MCLAHKDVAINHRLLDVPAELREIKAVRDAAGNSYLDVNLIDILLIILQKH